jgi:hypothetical protein
MAAREGRVLYPTATPSMTALSLDCWLARCSKPNTFSSFSSVRKSPWLAMQHAANPIPSVHSAACGRVHGHSNAACSKSNTFRCGRNLQVSTGEKSGFPRRTTMVRRMHELHTNTRGSLECKWCANNTPNVPSCTHPLQTKFDRKLQRRCVLLCCRTLGLAQSLCRPQNLHLLHHRPYKQPPLHWPATCLQCWITVPGCGCGL